MSPSEYFERQRRERGRIVAPSPIGCVIPAGPLNVEPVPIPRDAIPARLKSHDIDLGVDRDHVAEGLGDVLSRVLAEDRRLRNLLPPAPFGFEWHGELRTHEDFATMRITARIIYELREIR